MRIITFLVSLMLLTSVCFADQPTTVYSKILSGRVQGELPEVDGLNNLDLQNNANRVIKQIADELIAKQGDCLVSYKVTLNRPSLVGILLKAQNGDTTAYKAVNLDFTTGKELLLSDFLNDGMAYREVMGEYKDILFGEDGLYTRNADYVMYDKFVPYSELLPIMRTGEAGRLLSIVKLTKAVEDRMVTIKAGSMMAIKLDANRSTGFSWVMSDSAANADALAEVGRSYLMPSNIGGQVGTPGIEIITMAVREPGEYTVTMTYKRAWEKLGVQSFSFKVRAI